MESSLTEFIQTRLNIHPSEIETKKKTICRDVKAELDRVGRVSYDSARRIIFFNASWPKFFDINDIWVQESVRELANEDLIQQFYAVLCQDSGLSLKVKGKLLKYDT